jgi:oxalate decarboxylase/phosphoglucose isomerase-like protein (cupin superfamily)
MHDEVFITSAGTVRFHMPEADGTEKTIDAHVGDVVTVPIRAPHTFSNPFDESAKFVNTYTPAFYINYFKLLQEFVQKEGGMTREANMEAMERYATIVVEMEKKE